MTAKKPKTRYTGRTKRMANAPRVRRVNPLPPHEEALARALADLYRFTAVIAR